MLSSSNYPLIDAIKLLAPLGIEVSFLVPTATGLSKSILDAHANLRTYLSYNKIHDYSLQGQGPSHKVLIPVRLLDAALKSNGQPTEIRTHASLYRPETKTGDPRLWISGLPSVTDANDLLAIFVSNKTLIVVNLSRTANRSALAQPDSWIRQQLAAIINKNNIVVNELLEMLRDVAKRGFIKTMRSGPTGVGFTLETMLGIQANSSKSPDYKGIEIKAGRVDATGARTRSTLFSKTPDWKRSKLNALGVLTKYGYRNSEGRLQVYCTLDSNINTLGLYLDIDSITDDLDALYSASNGQVDEVIKWGMASLRAALAAKHKETFWVKALKDGSGASEKFHYVEVIHTTSPMISNLEPLFMSSILQLDLLMHEEPTTTGGIRVRDHGYLFKIHADNMNLLFPKPQRYSLI